MLTSAVLSLSSPDRPVHAEPIIMVLYVPLLVVMDGANLRFMYIACFYLVKGLLPLQHQQRVVWFC